jgi:chromosome segregation ATPase
MGNDSLVTLTLDKSIANNPKSIAELIVQLANDIDSCKNDLSTIKDRGWWDKLTSNNTKDLASAMLKQNDTITLFLNIVQSIIMLHMHNTLVLGQIQEHLNMHERSKGNFENKYTNMAKEFISQSYNAAISLKNKIENNEQTLLDIKNDIISKNEIDEQQTLLINQLRTDIDEHEVLDKEQHKIIQELKNELLEHDAIDNALKQTIRGLKNELKEHEKLDKACIPGHCNE